MASSPPDPGAFRSRGVLTLGVEEEFFVLDEHGHVHVDGAARLLDGVQPVVVPGAGRITTELFRSVLETSTEVCDGFASAATAVRALRTEVDVRARERGLGVASCGAHPFADPGAQRTGGFPSDLELAELHRAAGQLEQQLTCGLHVHVGMPDLATALHVTDELGSIAHVLVALAASSPWWSGADTGFASVRSEFWRRDVYGGMPPAGLDESAYTTSQAAYARISGKAPRFRWGVAPVDEYGTVEVRLMDAQGAPERSLALVALVHTAAAHVLEHGPLSPHGTAPGPVRDLNLWSAIVHGTDALVTAPDGAPEPVEASARRLLDALAPTATGLGTSEHLAWLDQHLLEADYRAVRKLLA